MEEIFKGISLENWSINPRASLARAAFKRDFLFSGGFFRGRVNFEKIDVDKDYSKREHANHWDPIEESFGGIIEWLCYVKYVC